MPLTTRLELALIAACGIAAWGDTRGASSATEVGLGVHQLDQPSVTKVVDLGVRHVRFTLYWSLWDNEIYRGNWERGLARAVNAGLDPLIVVHQPPFGDLQSHQRVYRAFARFMEARAAQFPEVPAWQLWNEMDVAFTDVFGAGHSEISMTQRGRLYAEMLATAYPAIKRGNPRALVVTGGIASSMDGGFLAGMYEGKARYDVLAIHTYGFPLVGPFDARGLAARRIMRAHHDNRPLWNTEFGLEGGVIPSDWRLTPAQIDTAQLIAWRTSIESNDRNRVYDRIYGYVLTEGKDLGFDLVRRDGSQRPTYRWLKSWMRQ